ncbi:hypothetical protein Lalb_Chr18g0051911 [Lupinus albus]|uniref:Uncharacterized protein n=1 Tax=Lupinus albus TaxID=3870 RepID=A0A6A4NYN4_LUPAL|nr:hypothetical protein Lalb_Chr18g0051911 [Lupinus albus]
MQLFSHQTFRLTFSTLGVAFSLTPYELSACQLIYGFCMFVSFGPFLTQFVVF